MALVGILTLLTAGLLLLARIFKLGFLADFLSRTALVGFLTGVGIQVDCNARRHAGPERRVHRTLGQLKEVAVSIQRFALALELSVFVVGAILLGRWLVPRFPVPLVLVVGMIAASSSFHLAEYGVAVIGMVPGDLPSIRWPDVTWSDLAVLPGRGVVLDDHRAERRDVARLWH